MSSEWKQVRLGDFIDSCLGKMLDQKKNKGNFHPYLGNINVRWGEFELSDLSKMKFEDAEHERYSLKKGDLVVCEGGSEPGRCAIWEGEISDIKIQKALHRIRTLSGLVSGYLYYWFLLEGKNGSLEPFCTGTAIKHLTGKSLGNLKIALPPVSYQEKCVSILKSIDRKIKHNKKINQTLEQMAQALFKSWFVDFEPVKAKIAVLEAGGSQEDATLAAMTAISGKYADALVVFERKHPELYAELKVTAGLFPSAMQDSELGAIPVDWQVSPLSRKIKLTGGGTPKRSESSFWDGEICWYSVKDAPSESDVFVIDTIEKITKKGLDKSSAKLLPVGTTIISARGTVGKLALTAVEMAMNQSCYGISGGEFSGPLLTYLKVKQYVDVLKRNTHGAVFDTITTSTFETVVTLTASKPVNDQFEKIVTPLFNSIENNLRTNASLTQLRDTLLPKLLSGEITLPEAEQAVSEAENV
ncbi:restriction endonuclease subunit S [Pseudescherichia sp.]|uniref:restriction endonuclease subunit S n=1 Tax=Pseudescherichia sp. TaxID=2055881 RepID=UPI0028AA02E2|nr:restriction endonuclease subunit S [Pseudescherichia sp.]